MVDLDLLSQNLVSILLELTKNQNLLKYVVYNQDSPIQQPDLPLPYKAAIGKENGQIFPYPFDNTVETNDNTNIRVWYPEGIIDPSQATGETYLHFDIIVAKSLWLINDGVKSEIRPYKIMSEIINCFKDKSVDTVGILKFTDFVHMSVNDKFQAVRITATITLLKQAD